VDFGFRLPSALDNRPLTFHEFEERVNQVIYTSATPSEYELSRADQIVEQVIRPTGVVDPEIIVRPVKGQIDDLVARLRERIERGQRVLVTTLTKRMAEDLADYLKELNFKVQYLHSEVQTIERVEILRDLRLGQYDVVVGINLLREGLDLPEVSMVAITNRRRKIQQAYNEAHGIEPRSIVKEIRDLTDRVKAEAEPEQEGKAALEELSPAALDRLIKNLEKEMRGNSRKQRRCETRSMNCVAFWRAKPRFGSASGAGDAPSTVVARGAISGIVN